MVGFLRFDLVLQVAGSLVQADVDRKHDTHSDDNAEQRCYGSPLRGIEPERARRLFLHFFGSCPRFILLQIIYAILF
jgi:hypothetical protein